MSQRCTKKDIQNIAETRNHLLVSMEGYKNIKSQIVLYCNECQRTFKTTLHSYKNAKRTGCPNCKKMSVSKHHKNKFVSSITRKKIGQANRNKPGSLKGRTGAEHPRWKGGYYDRLKGSSTDAYLWRKAVFKRYNNQCVLTGCTDNLDCHHLESWDICKQKRTDVLNGVVLAQHIHIKFHKRFGYGKNTEEQFARFCLIEFNVDWDLIKRKYDN